MLCCWGKRRGRSYYYSNDLCSKCKLYHLSGGKLVFADIDPYTYNICPPSIHSLITEKTKAIIPVDFTGQPADLNHIQSIANKHDLVVIEDVAHALGTLYKGRKVGSISDMTIFSFHPVKHITTGEGGVWSQQIIKISTFAQQK